MSSARYFHDDDLLSPAEADAIAAQYRPHPRAGVEAWTPHTRESYRHLDAVLLRPLFDQNADRGPLVDGEVAGARPRKLTDREAWRADRAREARVRREAHRAHVEAVQRVLGFRWDLTVVRALRAAALLESRRLRTT